MKFLADGMLGKLTRWLRMQGCDVKYYKDLEDEELIKIAKEETRVLLTRDVQLYRHAIAEHAQVYLVKCSTEIERLAEVAQQFNLNLEIDVNNSRCPKCNAKLEPISKNKVMDKVPKATLRFFDDYWVCSDCGQVYWQGSHWQKIKQKLNEVKHLIEN
ncbi:Mut7-C RNAse domain-containing protein [Candidatus Bathyarchaeota archaeon]|nr:Mut7-C RNAse domain-containing protein [Candidatus Bathyarchaeota archaeon]